MGLDPMDHWGYGISKAYSAKSKDQLWENLRGIPGLPKEASQNLLAIHELGRRIHSNKSKAIRRPEDAFEILSPRIHHHKECFFTLSLNGAHEVNSVNLVSIGTLNRTLVHPREIFHEMIQDHAAACMVGAEDIPIFCGFDLPLMITSRIRTGLLNQEKVATSGKEFTWIDSWSQNTNISFSSSNCYS